MRFFDDFTEDRLGGRPSARRWTYFGGTGGQVGYRFLTVENISGYRAVWMRDTGWGDVFMGFTMNAPVSVAAPFEIAALLMTPSGGGALPIICAMNPAGDDNGHWMQNQGTVVVVGEDRPNFANGISGNVNLSWTPVAGELTWHAFRRFQDSTFGMKVWRHGTPEIPWGGSDTTNCKQTRSTAPDTSYTNLTRLGFGFYSSNPTGAYLLRIGIATGADAAPRSRQEAGLPGREVQRRAWWLIAARSAVSATSITVQNAAHAHAADGPTLSEAATLSVAGATHAHVAQAIALVQAHVLAVAAASHAHSAASPTLSEAATIAVADALHAQAADSLTLTQAHVLAVAAATHAHAAGSLELNQALTLAVADALHGHAAGSPALTQAHLLSVAGASHGHTAESAALTQANVLALASALHAHAAGQPTLTSGDTLDVAGAAHGHMAGAVELVQAHLLSVDGATHAHTVETFALSAGYTLAVANALHAHAAGAPTLTSGVELAVASALHLHAAGALDITQASTLVVSDALHAHLAELVRLRMPGAKARLIFVIQRQDRVLVVAPRNRTLTVH